MKLRGTLKSPVSWAIIAFFVFVIWPLFFWNLTTRQQAEIAAQKAQIADAQITLMQAEIKQMQHSPFIDEELIGFTVDGKSEPLGKLAIVDQCAVIGETHLVTVNQKIVVAINRQFSGNGKRSDTWNDTATLLPGKANILTFQKQLPPVFVPGNFVRLEGALHGLQPPGGYGMLPDFSMHVVSPIVPSTQGLQPACPTIPFSLQAHG